MTLRQVDELSAREFHEWVQYDALFPFGDERADWRSAQIAQILANVHSKKSHSVRDFMLQPPKTKAQEEQALKAAVRRSAKR